MPFHLGWNSTERSCDCRRGYHDHIYKPQAGRGRCTRAQLPRVGGSDVTSIHKYMVRRYFNKPSRVPAPELRTPSGPHGCCLGARWTRTRCKRFAQQDPSAPLQQPSHLKSRRHVHSCLRRLRLREAKFPSASDMFRRLRGRLSRHALGAPFVNYNSSRFGEGVERELFVRPAHRPAAGSRALVEWHRRGA